jgi:short-subunit dehydrogenase
MSIKDKIVVITGATGGIGLETAQLLSKHGAIPVLTGRSEQKLLEMSNSIQGEHDVYKLDVTSTGEVAETMEKIAAVRGKIDILINNAGFAVFDRFEDAALEQMEEMMDVNYWGTVRCTKAVLPHMLREGRGHIVNVASMAGKIGSSKAADYAATKHAVLGFTNSLRQEMAGTGIMISAVNPGPVDTPFFDRADPSGRYRENVAWFLLKPEQVAQAIVDVIIHGKSEKDLPFLAMFGVKLYQLLPGLFEKIAGRVLNKK